MKCTESAPTQSNPRVTDMTWTATLQIAHTSRMVTPMRSPPTFLPGIRPSAHYVGVPPLPSLFLFSHHAPEYSISKRGISSSRLAPLAFPNERSVLIDCFCSVRSLEPIPSELYFALYQQSLPLLLL